MSETFAPTSVHLAKSKKKVGFELFRKTFVLLAFHNNNFVVQVVNPFMMQIFSYSGALRSSSDCLDQKLVTIGILAHLSRKLTR